MRKSLYHVCIIIPVSEASVTPSVSDPGPEHWGLGRLNASPLPPMQMTPLLLVHLRILMLDNVQCSHDKAITASGLALRMDEVQIVEQYVLNKKYLSGYLKTNKAPQVSRKLQIIRRRSQSVLQKKRSRWYCNRAMEDLCSYSRREGPYTRKLPPWS